MLSLIRDVIIWSFIRRRRKQRQEDLAANVWSRLAASQDSHGWIKLQGRHLQASARMGRMDGDITSATSCSKNSGSKGAFPSTWRHRTHYSILAPGLLDFLSSRSTHNDGPHCHLIVPPQICFHFITEVVNFVCAYHCIIFWRRYRRYLQPVYSKPITTRNNDLSKGQFSQRGQWL